MPRALFVLAVSLAVAAALSGPAGADQVGSVSGNGMRAEWTVAGVVHATTPIAGHVDWTGHFTIVRHVNPVFRPTVCSYDTFSNVSITGGTATFDAEGVCRGESDFGEFEFAASNRFTIVDNGEPGAGVDTVDVNFLGPGGIAVPGGTIDSGNFQVTG